MNKYRALLKKFSFEGYSVFSHIKEEDWGNQPDALRYLQNYGLYEVGDGSHWKVKLDCVFDRTRKLPKQIFQSESFEFMTLQGGMAFEKNDFERFASCLQKIGEKSFYMIQNTFGVSHEEADVSLRMQFPVDLTWDELMNGNFISAVLFEYPRFDYFIFGGNYCWGLYIANEYVDETVFEGGTPIRILGCSPKLTQLFRQAFQIPEDEFCESFDYIPGEERLDLRKITPPAYRPIEDDSKT